MNKAGMMNIILWVIQAIIAIKLVTVVITHGLQQSKSTMRDAIEKSGGNPKLLLYAIAGLSLLAVVGVLLPVQFGVFPLIYAGVILLASIPFHLRCREKPKVFVSLILFLMVCAVYYGRWILYI